MENDSPRDVLALSQSTPERLCTDGFLTVKEAQERLGRSRSFLARATRAGVLPRYRIGYGRGRVVLAIEDVDALAVPRPAGPEAAGLPRRTPTPRDGGFTLLELLVTVIIIGILAAIAIPVFMNQKSKAFDTAVKSDLKNFATQAETYASDTGVYPGTIAGWTAGIPSSPDRAYKAYISGGQGFVLLGTDRRTGRTWAVSTWGGTVPVAVTPGAVWTEGTVTAWPGAAAVLAAPTLGSIGEQGVTGFDTAAGVRWGASFGVGPA